MEHLIELKNICKSFDGVEVLKDINLYIDKNEFVTLLGPSGCGKSTILRIIAGFETPDSGDLLFENKSILSVPPYERTVNTVFQKYALFPHLNVADNIAFGDTIIHILHFICNYFHCFISSTNASLSNRIYQIAVQISSDKEKARWFRIKTIVLIW